MVLDGVKNSGSDLFGGSARPPTRGPQARAANAAKETRNLEKLHKQHRRAAAAAENMQSHDANNQTGGSDGGAHYVSPYDIPQPVPNANFRKKKKKKTVHLAGRLVGVLNSHLWIILVHTCDADLYLLDLLTESTCLRTQSAQH